MKKGHVKYFSELRALSCVAIVFLHTFFCADLIFQPGGAADVASMIIRNCMTFAVPCFVMISGALLLNPAKEITISAVFRRYIARVVKALLLFTFLFALFDFAVDGSQGGAAALFGGWLRALFTSGSWLHMWYLYMLIGLYLMLPLYRILSAHMSEKELAYLLILYFIFQSIIPTVVSVTGTGFGFYIFVYTVYPFYLFLGYALHSTEVRISWIAGAVLAVGGTAGLIFLTWVAVPSANQNLLNLLNNHAYASVLAVAQAAGIFILMQKTEKMPLSGAGRFLHALDRCSFGIYLIHVLVLFTVYRVLHFNPYQHGGVAMLCLLAVTTLAISWCAVFLLKKIPGLKEIL